MLSLILYLLFLKLYYLIAWVISPFNPKAKKWLNGRRDAWTELSKLEPAAKRIWIHCASLGEFEQAKPLIEGLKKQCPEFQLIITFFSPSGYEQAKRKHQMDHLFYLPHDSKKNAKRFISVVQPDLAIFIKYEFWHFYLAALNKHKIPTLLVSAIFTENDIFFRWWSGFFLQMLKTFTHIFVQDKASAEVLHKNGFNNVTVTGDTRIDRVITIQNENKTFPLVKQFVGDQKVLIAGSLEPGDESLIIELINANNLALKFVIAPHQISRSNSLQKQINRETIKYSEFNPNNKTAEVLIIDNIGMLSSLYKYGHLVYIGGGFDNCLHNLLEPAVFGLPLIFGPNYHKFIEAKVLVELKGGFSIKTKEELFSLVQKLEQDEGFYEATAKVTYGYIQQNKGATQKVLAFIENQLFSE